MLSRERAMALYRHRILAPPSFVECLVNSVEYLAVKKKIKMRYLGRRVIQSEDSKTSTTVSRGKFSWN